MKRIKFVKLPGEIREFMVGEGTTARELLEMAGITDTSELAIQGDDVKISLDDDITEYDLVSVSKRLKGARF